MPDRDPELQMSDEEAVLCWSCGYPNPVGIDFCEECHKHISPYGTIEPLKRIFVEGDVFRGIKQHRRKPIVILGVIFIVVPYLIYGGLIAYFEFERDVRHFFRYEFEKLWNIFGPTVIVATLCLVLLATLWWRRRRIKKV